MKRVDEPLHDLLVGNFKLIVPLHSPASLVLSFPLGLNILASCGSHKNGIENELIHAKINIALMVYVSV